MGFIGDMMVIYRGFIWDYMGFIGDMMVIYRGFIWDLYGIYRGYDGDL